MSEVKFGVLMRIPRALWERAEALLPYLENAPELASSPKVTKTALFRYVIGVGLTELEEKYAPKKGA